MDGISSSSSSSTRADGAPAPSSGSAAGSGSAPAKGSSSNHLERLRNTNTHPALQSPTSSVQALLADTNLAPPSPRVSFNVPDEDTHGKPSSADSTSKTYSEAVKEGEGPSQGSTGGDDVQPSNTRAKSRSGAASTDNTASQQTSTQSAIPSQPSSSTRPAFVQRESHRPTFQQTLADLRQFLMPFLKLLPFQSLQGYLKVFIGPFVRFIVRIVAQILHRWNFGLASNLAYDIHLLLWKVSRVRWAKRRGNEGGEGSSWPLGCDTDLRVSNKRAFMIIRAYSGSSTSSSGRSDPEGHTRSPALDRSSLSAGHITIR